MLSGVGATPSLSPPRGVRSASGRGMARTLTKLIVIASYPLSAATLVAGLVAEEPLVTAGGACGLAAPVLGSVQLGLGRPHPSFLMALWAAWKLRPRGV